MDKSNPAAPFAVPVPILTAVAGRLKGARRNAASLAFFQALVPGLFERVRGTPLRHMRSKPVRLTTSFKALLPYALLCMVVNEFSELTTESSVTRCVSIATCEIAHRVDSTIARTLGLY